MFKLSNQIKFAGVWRDSYDRSLKIKHIKVNEKTLHYFANNYNYWVINEKKLASDVRVM